MSIDAGQRDYVSATAGPTITARARRSPLLFVGLAIFAIIITILVTQSRPADNQDLSIDNTAPNGAHAVAQILRDQGVGVRQVNLLSDARIEDPKHTTLVIVASSTFLSSAQSDSIAGYPGDIVYLGLTPDALEAAGPDLYYEYAEPGATVVAQCADPDAVAAEETRTGEDSISIGGLAPHDAELCFPDAEGGYAYARVETDLGARIFLANPHIATNDKLDELGNAALTLRAMGRHESVTWYVGSYADTTTLTWGDDGLAPDKITTNPNFLPPGTADALFALGLAALIAAFWRARRFGPLVTEPLPVVVRSSEATRGRARLYRRARATGRSTAAIRGLVALRIGQRLGVPRAAGKAGLLEAITRTTGRNSGDVDALLYGPPPANETAMMQLVERLDQLESEVHQP
ncbi:DUF4350 domain-containing protein [Demequina oxidasica]|uniref:DUF4350 domain-containing protein n=1 Tax=Demequina oxidasica TaxID=676199 RepID=UPI0007862430|nr:DUF4350 domain-containing protein [Demequina oxidasica]